MAGQSDFCRFFKIQDFDIQIKVEISLKTLIFRLKFFSNVSKKFLLAQQVCSRYLEGVFYLPVYAEKRMKVIRHVDQNIFKNY